ncbi:MAG: glycosyltransferase family 4 protein [Caldilineaceae bacterium]|nr:glycosyltransferase family 4 protein [Caldilineaceae bacterium]
MRIGIDTHFITSAHATGNRTYTAELVRALVAVGQQHEYVLYAVGDHPYYQQFVNNPRVQVRHVLSGRGLIRNFISLPKAIAQDQLDIVHLQFILPWLISVPTLLAIHDLYYLQPSGPAFYEQAIGKLTAWSARRARHIATLSEYSRRDIMAQCAVREDRVTTIPGAIDRRFAPVSDRAAIQSLREKVGIARDYVLFVGRTEDPRKNIGSLLDAYIALRRQGQITDQLVIAGRHGAGTALLQEKVHSAGLAEDVLFPGVIADLDLPILMTGAKLFVYVSSFEGFGLPVLEAMACGTPVITSNTTSLPEVAGDAALCVTPGNVDELMRAMQQVLQNAELQNQLRERGLQRAKLFSWERAARETLAIYEKIGLS